MKIFFPPQDTNIHFYNTQVLDLQTYANESPDVFESVIFVFMKDMMY